MINFDDYYVLAIRFIDIVSNNYNKYSSELEDCILKELVYISNTIVNYVDSHELSNYKKVIDLQSRCVNLYYKIRKIK